MGVRPPSPTNEVVGMSDLWNTGRSGGGNSSSSKVVDIYALDLCI